MKGNNLTDKEYDILWELLEKANVLWQYYEKDHIAQDLTDEQWNKFLIDCQDGFSDGTYETAVICVEDFKSKLEENNESK